jgi:hypothetical protein
VLWDRTFGGVRDEVGKCVRQTTDNGYIIVGITNSFGMGYYDIWLIKTNSIGNIVWDKTFGGTSNDRGRCVQQTTDGGYIIIGTTVSFGVDGDVWLIKTDSTGNMVWNRTFGGADTDYGLYGQQTTDGGYIITGRKSDAIWLIKTDSTGNMVWNTTFENYGFKSWSRCVQQTIDGGYIIIGFRESDGVGKLFDSWSIKTDCDGNKIWNRMFGETWLTSIEYGQQTTDGGYIIVGTKLLPFGFSVYMAKISKDGDEKCNKIIGGLGYYSGNCIQQTTDGGYIITGEADGNVLLIKTNEIDNIKNKPVTNSLLMRLLERLPLLQRLYNVWR